MTSPRITHDERNYLRELARKYRHYTELPVMAERKRLWYEHNALHGSRPLVVMEISSFIDDLLPPQRCSSSLARTMERYLLAGIVNHELVDDDKVLSCEYVLPLKVWAHEFDMDLHTERASDASGRTIGYAVAHPIVDLERDLPAMRHSVFHLDRQGTAAERAVVEEAIGDILPVRVSNHSLGWHATPSAKIVHLMGMESMLVEMIEHPELMAEFYRFVVDDILAYLDWQEREGLLTLNNGNDYTGAGSYGFTHELPRSDAGSAVRTRDLWGNMNSQETLGISPGMYEELIYPAYERLAGRFGLVYYGCCEPVHDLWDKCLCRLPNLRKLSVSAWCDEMRIGQSLRGSRVIYSRKPSPNFIGVGTFREEVFTQHIAHTLTAARGCHLEILFRDIYSLDGDRTKPGRAVKIVREQIRRTWNG